MHHEYSWCTMSTHDASWVFMMHHEYLGCIYFGRNRGPPMISLEAAGASKDNFRGILSSSDFPRNPQILKTRLVSSSRDSFRQNSVESMRNRGPVTSQPSVLLIGRSRPRKRRSLLTGGAYELEMERTMHILMVHRCPWCMLDGSWLMAQGSWLMAKGGQGRLMAHGQGPARPNWCSHANLLRRFWWDQLHCHTRT